jgi:hypothetical protein
MRESSAATDSTMRTVRETVIAVTTARQLGSGVRGDGSLHRAVSHRAADDEDQRTQAVADPLCDEPLIGGMAHLGDQTTDGQCRRADRDARPPPCQQPPLSRNVRAP